MRLFTTTDWTVKRGMLTAGLIAAACAVISFYLPPWVLFMLATAILLTLLVPRFRHPVWVYGVIWTVVFLCTFGRYHQTSAEPVRRLAGQRDTVTAQVVEMPASGRMLTVEILDADKLPHGSCVLLYANELVAPKQHEIIRAEVELKELYPTQRRYQADGVFLQAYPVAYDEDAMTVTTAPFSWRSALSPLRERLIANIRERLNGEEGALIAGICLGEKAGVSASAMTAFRRAGLPHILVVSGLHLSVISTGIYWLLRLVLSHRRLAAVLTMAAVGLFMALVGFTPSVVRAGVMCLVMLGGQLFMRRADGLNSMGISLILLLVISPYCLLDVGLQLSFGAAGGVLCLARPIEERLRAWHFGWLSGGLAVTFAATLPILPLLGYYFGEVSVVSPIANLLAVAPAGVALGLGWVGAVLSLISPLAFLSNGVLYLAGRLVRWLLFVARVVGGLPFATVPTERAWTILYLTGGCGLVILCLCKVKRGLLRRLLVFMAAALVLACGTHRILCRDTTTVTVSNRADGAALFIEQDGRHGLVAQDVSGISVNDAFIRACNGELDFVIVGDGKPADAAYLTDLLRQVSVKRLYVTENAAFTVGLARSTEPLTPNTEIALWSESTMTLDADGKWLLSFKGTTLAVTPEKACDVDGAIFVGEPPKESMTMTIGQGILLADNEDDAALGYAGELPYPMAAVTEDTVYLTTRGGGEWSVNRWR